MWSRHMMRVRGNSSHVMNRFLQEVFPTIPQEILQNSIPATKRISSDSRGFLRLQNNLRLQLKILLGRLSMPQGIPPTIFNVILFIFRKFHQHINWLIFLGITTRFTLRIRWGYIQDIVQRITTWFPSEMSTAFHLKIQRMDSGILQMMTLRIPKRFFPERIPTEVL